jgi:hypothetical protein
MKDESAFPHDSGMVHEGITKREWFAAMAMQSMGYTMSHFGQESETLAKVAKTAYRMADEMLSPSNRI